MLSFEHIRPIAKKGAYRAVACAAACALALPAGAAWAVDVETAQSSLDAAERRMDQIVAEHEGIVQEIETSQRLIDETTARAVEAQDAMLDGRETLSALVEREYRNDSVGALFALVLSAESFSDFLRNVDYARAYMEATSEEIEAQRQRKDAFESALDELDRQRDEQQRRLDAAQEKKEEAQRVVDAASSALVDAQAEEAARVQALAEQAARLEEERQQSEQAPVSDGWNTIDREDGAGQSQTPPAGGSSEGDAPSSGEGSSSNGGTPSTGGSSAGESTGWMTGVASAYGGSSDPNTPNPGMTSTGAVCDDSSMGVAIPMSWPNYSSYLGRSVEISYGGATVIAVVNDVGYMGGGARSLDLQPGVFKALGFSTCQDWGVRTVSYRFL